MPPLMGAATFPPNIHCLPFLTEEVHVSWRWQCAQGKHYIYHLCPGQIRVAVCEFWGMVLPAAKTIRWGFLESSLTAEPTQQVMVIFPLALSLPAFPAWNEVRCPRWNVGNSACHLKVREAERSKAPSTTSHSQCTTSRQPVLDVTWGGTRTYRFGRALLVGFSAPCP